MPPIMNPWQDNPQILAKHPELQGHDTCNYILTDLSKGFTDRVCFDFNQINIITKYFFYSFRPA